jgi:hypothetical protein
MKTSSPGLRATAVIAFAVCLFLGMMLTPPAGAGAAGLLQSLREHSLEANLTALFRFLTSILIVPALLAIAPSIPSRGIRPFRIAAVLLYLGSLAGVVVFTQMVLQNAVLAPMPNHATALEVAEAIAATLLWQISAPVYLLGLLSGFLLLGISLWRAGLGRLIAAAVALGLFVHIAGGDWIATSMTGALILGGGLTALGLTLIREGGRRQQAQRAPDPAHHLVSHEPRPRQL